MAADKRKRQRVPPSRQRYEESHPVVSVRIPREMREELQLVNTASGMSVADVLRVGLDKARPAVENAFNLGFEDARVRYEVTYWCSRCEKWDMSITTEKEKEAVAEFMYRQGWHHARCR